MERTGSEQSLADRSYLDKGGELGGGSRAAPASGGRRGNGEAEGRGRKGLVLCRV